MASSTLLRTSHRLLRLDTHNDITSLFATAELSKNFKDNSMIVKNIMSWKALSALSAILGFGLLVTASMAHADAAPVITSSLRGVSENVITAALIGASVHDVVSVASTTGAVPTGTVHFNVYANTACLGTVVTQSSVPLVNGIATSSASILGAGGISYKVHYNGDINTVAADGSCVFVSATSNTVTLTQTLSTTTPVAVGTSVSDAVTLTNMTAQASGTVAYVIYSDPACTIPLQGAGVKTVTNGIVPNSDIVQFNIPGIYRWQAVYSGDTQNAAATSTCANALLTVHTPAKTNTAITTTLSTTSAAVGTNVFDSAILTGMTAQASGTVAYTIYSDAACTVALQNAGTVAVTNGNVPNSSSVAFNAAGTYYWRAAYSGDANNNASMSACLSEVLAVNPTPTSVHFIVDKVTVPATDPTSFSFTTTGTGYVGFTLTDSTTPNNQTLTPGSYSVTETSVTGWTQTSAMCSKNGAAATAYTPGSAMALVATDTVSCVFTNTFTATSTPGSATLSGTVYNDVNKNGMKDTSEVGIGGFVMNLYQGAGWSGPTNKAPFKTVTTDANGAYSFTGLSDGVYSIEEINQPTWTQFTSDFKTVTVSGGANQSGFDFGNVQKTGSGGGNICEPRHDADNNGNHYGQEKRDENRGAHNMSVDNHQSVLEELPAVTVPVVQVVAPDMTSASKRNGDDRSSRGRNSRRGH